MRFSCVSVGAFQQLIQVFCKLLERKELLQKPPVDNNHHAHSGTTWNSEVGHLILTGLMIEILNISFVFLFASPNE